MLGEHRIVFSQHFPYVILLVNPKKVLLEVNDLLIIDLGNVSLYFNFSSDPMP